MGTRYYLCAYCRTEHKIEEGQEIPKVCLVCKRRAMHETDSNGKYHYTKSEIDDVISSESGMALNDLILTADEESAAALKEARDERERKTERKLELPSENRTIGRMALEISQFYSKDNKIFYNLLQKEVVRLGMVAVEKNGKEELKTMGFLAVNDSDFITLLETDFSVGFWKQARGGEVWSEKSITKATANSILKSVDQFRERLPIIQEFYNVQMPILKDGKLELMKRGYDPVFMTWIPHEAPMVKTDVTLEEAKKIIESLFGEFCFATEQDKINAIAALLTPYCRKIYARVTARTPLFFYMGNRERAGKDYCAGITGIVYEAAAIEDSPISTEKENHSDEFRKKQLATLRMGRRRLHSSNNKGHINSAELESAITSEHVIDRLLGQSTMIQLPNLIEYSLSANTGITYTSDLSRRCVFINLFFADEDPNGRTFTNPNLHEWVAEHRSDILSALYAFIRTWVEKGMISGYKPFTSFPEWARVVGGVMESCGYLSPASNDVLNAIGGDTETTDMARLFELGYIKWPEQWIAKQEIYKEFENYESDFAGLFPNIDWSKSISARTKFSILLGKFEGRIFGGVRLDATQERSARQKYKFTKKLLEGQQRFGSNLVTLVRFGNVFPSSEQQIDKIKDTIQNLTNHTNLTKIEDFQEIEKPKEVNLQGFKGEVVCPNCGKDTPKLYDKNGKWCCGECFDTLGPAAPV